MYGKSHAKATPEATKIDKILAKKHAWEPPGTSKIDPKWLPGRSRDISGSPGATPSWGEGLPDAPGERQGRPKEPHTSSWDVPRSLPETSKSDPGAKKTRPWSVFNIEKGALLVFHRFFYVFLPIFGKFVMKIR